MKSWKKTVGVLVVAVALLVSGAAVTNSASANEFVGKNALPKMTTVLGSYMGYGTVKPGAKIYNEEYTLKTTPKTVAKNRSASVLYDIVKSNGHLYRMVEPLSQSNNEYYVKNSEIKLLPIGKGHVNYNKHYGIQIWTSTHRAVLNKNKKAKKLPGQSNWNIYGLYTLMSKDGSKNLGNYYNLGGDQYISAKYISFKLASGLKGTDIDDLTYDIH